MVQITDNEGKTMALVKAQCTKCGAILDVDEKNDADICPSCGAPYIVENAIHLYKTNNSGVNPVFDTNPAMPPKAEAEPVSTEQFKTVVKDPEAEKQKDLKLFLGVMIPVVIVAMIAIIILLKAYY